MMQTFISVIFLGYFTAFVAQAENLTSEFSWPEKFLKLYIPTLRATREKCRNHSEFYYAELKNYRLWATEMFDATTKFPNGILYGSHYDFGNFDECLDLKMIYQQENVYAKYCLVKFKMSPSKETHSDLVDDINYETSDYMAYFNISMWQKIMDYSNERSRSPRNEVHAAFCMPASCSYEDLRLSMQEILWELNNMTTDIDLEIDVKAENCQTFEDRNHLDIGDKIFISVILIALIGVILSSVYDYVIQQDSFSQYRLFDSLHEVVLCFSFQRNFGRLTSVGNNADKLQCMSGMKVYSMFLIILLHRNMFDFGSAIMNPKFVEQYYSNFALTFILNGPLLVDTFFTISGFLATYLSLHYFFKRQNITTVLMLYFHRYARMAPTYAVVLAFYCTLMVKLGNGPLWYERIGYEQQKCRSSWWANILFINNYVNTENYCMFQSWYMACDMNAFIFVPILCLLLIKTPRIGILTTILLLVASIVAVFTTVYVYDEDPILLLYMRMLLAPNTDSTFLRIYIPGHMRAASYFIGVLAGYIRYQMNLGNCKLDRRWCKIGWIACVPMMFLSMNVAFVFYNENVPALYSAIYASLHHVFWSFGIAWMIIAISTGYGSWIEGILSWYPLVLLSRLTYTVYLCHATIQLYSAGSLRQPIYGSTFNSIHSTASDIVLAYIMAFMLTMLFESPISGLEKLILWKDKRQKSATNKEESGSPRNYPL